uniref:Uncharacterized protein n=1 Tax=Timema monikensis TaxID=170555 RepID=A0A7R9EHE1_9NEOP|nr:unnamed protein product [Timema monikensis]
MFHRNSAWDAQSHVNSMGRYSRADSSARNIGGDGNKLISKWKNGKDHYLKCKRNSLKSGSGASKKFKYTYADQLSFLSKIDVARTTSASSMEDAEGQSAEDEVESQTDLGPNQLTKNKANSEQPKEAG